MKVKRLVLSMVALVLALVAATVLAANAVDDPLVVNFTSGTVSNDGPDGLPYVHGESGVRALLSPGTGNVILDPDGDAKGKTSGRAILLDLPGAPDVEAFFISINSVGKWCDDSLGAEPARDLELGECNQSNVAVNGLEGFEELLRCGEDPNDPSNPDRQSLDNVAVTCVEEDPTDPDKRCVRWSVTPWRPDGRVNCSLFDWQGKGKNKQLVVVEGPFDMSFTAEVCSEGFETECVF